MKRLLGMAIWLWGASAALAAMHTEALPYHDGDVALEGYLVYDDAATGKRPAVLVVHEWLGLGDYAKHRANMLAKMGYVALAVDMYGKGVFAKSHEEAARLSGAFRDDRAKMRKRINAALEILSSRPEVDSRRIAAVGYCFGGMAVLELARSGADVRAVASFHGSYGTPHPEDAKNIRGKVLICHGDEDRFSSPADIEALRQEMRAAGVDWELNIYGGAVHSFTVPDAGSDKSTGVAYNEPADKRSWAALQRLLEEVFVP